MQLLLASRSETRRAMLAAAGVPFGLVESLADEDQLKASLRQNGYDAQALALGLAEAKALGARAGADRLVLGCDQTLETEDGRMLDKPATPADARDQLRWLAGRSHRLHSAAAVAENGEVRWRATETVTLHIRPLSDTFIARYVEEEYEAIRWSVGGYMIEGRGIQLFDRIEGSHFAILGLPLLPLLGYLRERGLVPD